ncbi:MAG: dethiobiotin synthase [Clostridium sp.]
MSKGVFITATGTDVGKTYISGNLLRKLRKAGMKVGYFKAALSGAIVGVEKELIPGDAKYVYNMAGIEGDFNDSIPYILETESSPHLAAQLEGVEINLKTIINHYENHSKQYDFVLSEGSGGIVCPIYLQSEKIMLMDVIKGLNLEIVIVSDAGLGTINSTMLTVEYARNHNIGIKGIILNNFDKDNFIHVDNLKVIKDFTGLQVYICETQGEVEIKEEELVKLFN